MSNKADAQKQIRLHDSIYDDLVKIKQSASWKVSLTSLANYSALMGMAKTKEAFPSKRTQGKAK